MATGKQIFDALKVFANKYATKNQKDPAHAMDDPIDPAFSSLSDADRTGAFNDLGSVLNSNGIQSNIGIEQMKQCKTWGNLRATIFDQQPTD